MNTKPTAATGTVCNSELFHFPAVKKRAVCASFTGGAVTSDGGITLLRQTDRRLGLTKALAKVLPDPRDPERIEHPLLSLVRQRIYGLAQGYEDLNDHDTLRHDLVWQTAVERGQPLASSPTLCRLENRANRQMAWAVHEVLVDQFIASFAQPPAELVLDFDATDDRVHGQQEGHAQRLYDELYCARGEMENRIKEQQLGLFADRTSCHGWWANQFRLLLSSCAYVLMERLRALALRGTELARAQVGTIRLKLLKIGAVVLRNTRRVRLLLSSSYPYQTIFRQVVKALGSG
jgi:hypothetical protein